MSTAAKHFLRTFSRASPIAHHPLRPLQALPPKTALAAASLHTSAARMTVHEFKTKGEYDGAIQDNKVVLLDCSASWCGPCKMISPVFDKLSDDPENSDIYFAKFDVDEVPDLAAELGIRAMPTFKAIVGGKVVDEMMGANPPALQTLVAKHKSKGETEE